MKFFLVGALVLLPSASAVPWAGPTATPSDKPHAAHEGWSPATTASAGREYDLFKRQGVPTCGYINGEFSRSVTCNTPGDVCATNTQFGVFGCCPGTDLADCTLATACIPNASTAECTGACATDSYVTLCDAAAPYCRRDIFVLPDSSFTYFGCGAVETTLTVYPSYNGASSTVAFMPFILTTTVVNPVTPSPPSPSPTLPVKHTPTGAIAGGVVGGIVVLAALAAGVYFLYARRRREAAAYYDGRAAPSDAEWKPPPANPAGATGAAPGVVAMNSVPADNRYVQPAYAPGAPPPEKTAAVASAYPVQQQQQQPQMSYAHDAQPMTGYAPQPGQQSPTAMSPPLSPAPPYWTDPNQAGHMQPQPGGGAPPMGSMHPGDGTQHWHAAAPAVYEVAGSEPVQR